MFEHMIFKGTKHVRAEAHAQFINGVGGYVNAQTDEDATHYINTLPSDHLDFAMQLGGGQVSIRAPRIKGLPGGDSLFERVRSVIDNEINPQLASHNGRVSIEAITADNAVLLRFGGGCHGCGMAGVTLREGVEKTLRARVPEITAVVDATDHDSGLNPYIKRRA